MNIYIYIYIYIFFILIYFYFYIVYIYIYIDVYIFICLYINRFSATVIVSSKPALASDRPVPSGLAPWSLGISAGAAAPFEYGDENRFVEDSSTTIYNIRQYDSTAVRIYIIYIKYKIYKNTKITKITKLTKYESLNLFK